MFANIGRELTIGFILLVVTLVLVVVLLMAFSKNKKAKNNEQTLFKEVHQQYLFEIISYIFDSDDKELINEKIKTLVSLENEQKRKKDDIDISCFLNTSKYYVFLFHNLENDDCKYLFYFCSKKSESLRKLPETSYQSTHQNYVALFSKDKLTKTDEALLFYIYGRRAVHKSYKYCDSIIKLANSFPSNCKELNQTKDDVFEYVYKILSNSSGFIRGSIEPEFTNNLLLELLKCDNQTHLDLAMQMSQLFVDMYNDGYNKPRFHKEMDLFNLAKSFYGDAIYQYRAKWLGKKTVDIYIPSIKTAIEFQGQQHYKPVEAFGGEETYKNNVTRDKEKKALLYDRGIRLIEWKYDVEISKDNLLKCIKNAD